MGIGDVERWSGGVCVYKSLWWLEACVLFKEEMAYGMLLGLVVG